MSLPGIMLESIDMFVHLVLQFFDAPTLLMSQSSIVGPGHFLQAVNTTLFLPDKLDLGSGKFTADKSIFCKYLI